MKIALVAFNNIKFCPYINPYKKFFNENGVDCDLIYFDRENIEHEREQGMAIDWDKKKNKLFNFLYFVKQVKKILKTTTYDFVVVLTTLPGVLLTNFLSKKYKNKYLIDVRDYTYEKYFFYRHYEKKLFKNAKDRVISSPGFVNFLPKNKYVICHNTDHNILNSKFKFNISKGKIIIGYVGTVAYVEKCKKMIDLVSADDRFEFHFYGNVRDKSLLEYANDINCERIKFFGAYDPKDKEEIVKKVDVLFNMYGNESLLVKYALSNKLYDSFYYKKPLITSPNTEMSRLSENFSCDVDMVEENLDKVFTWYNSIDESRAQKTIIEFAKQVDKDRIDFIKTLESIIQKK